MRNFFLLFILIPLVAEAQQENSVLNQLRNELKNAKTPEERVDALNELSWEYAPLQFDSAFRFAHEAFQIATTFHYEEGIGTAYNRLGAALDMHGDYIEAIENYQLAADYRLSKGDSIGYSNVLINIGACYYYQGVFKKALEFYLEAERVKSKTNDKKGLAQIYNNLGLVYRVQRNYERALHYYNLSLEIKRELDDRQGMIYTLTNLGVIYQNFHNCDSALLYAQQSYDLSVALQSTFDRGTSLSNLAMAYACMGEYEKSLEIFDRTEALLDSIDDKNTLAYALKAKSELLFKLKKIQEAILVLNEAEAVCEKVGRSELMSEIYLLKSQLLKSRGDYAGSLKAFEQYVVLKDSLFNDESNRQIIEMETVYETNEKEARISELKTLSALQGEQAKSSRVQRNFLIIIVLFILLIVIMLVFVLKRNRENSKALSIKNKTIENSLREKEVLIREIHHRVKNNLQIISGLLELQGEKVKPEEAQRRIQTMSTIHEMLYRSQDISKISLQEYFEKLISNIAQGFGNKQVKIQIEIESVDFNIDTIIPLGLIANELVTNAFKYAFKEKESGLLIVKLSPDNGNTWMMQIRDNGQGVMGDMPSNESFGLRLVNLLARQLKGKMNYSFAEGSIFTIHFEPQKSEMK